MGFAPEQARGIPYVFPMAIGRPGPAPLAAELPLTSGAAELPLAICTSKRPFQPALRHA